VAYSGLSRSRLYTLIQSNELPSLQVGGRRIILRTTWMHSLLGSPKRHETKTE
jgi:predicted DNA-binding transcriptional regulator AlpA